MDLNNFFEDLEAEFESQILALQNQQLPPSVLPSGPIKVDLVFKDSTHLSLIAVTLGEDFVAGINPENGSAMAINIYSISRIIFVSTPAQESLELRNSGRTFAEFIQIFAEKKSLVRLKNQNSTHESAARIGWVQGSSRNLVCFFDRSSRAAVFYPADSVRSIETVSVHN